MDNFVPEPRVDLNHMPEYTIDFIPQPGILDFASDLLLNVHKMPSRATPRKESMAWCIVRQLVTHSSISDKFVNFLRRLAFAVASSFYHALILSIEKTKVDVKKGEKTKNENLEIFFLRVTA
jgi:hypothetical protein